MEVFGLVLFASIRYSPFAIRQKNKAGGTPADATPPIRTVRGAARALRGALRLPAFHRGSCGSEPTPPLSSRRASWDAASAAVTPPPPVPVQRSNRRPVIMPAGRFPEAARERRWRAPARRHRSRSTSRS